MVYLMMIKWLVVINLFDGIRKLTNYIENRLQELEKNMNTSDFNFVFLRSIGIKYRVPLDIFNTINQIYEEKINELYPANKQLVGKIKKEHSLFFDGQDTDKMKPHKHLSDNVMNWFCQMFKHYLQWNKIRDYKNAFKFLLGK